MKIYVAAKFEEKERVQRVYRALRQAGHTITHDWTQESSAGLTGDARERYLSKHAALDCDGVLDADVLLLLTHDRGYGSMVELGMAIASGVRVVVVEAEVRDCIFFHLVEVKCVASVEEAIHHIAVLGTVLGLEVVQ